MLRPEIPDPITVAVFIYVQKIKIIPENLDKFIYLNLTPEVLKHLEIADPLYFYFD